MPKKKVENEASESNEPMTRKEIATALAKKTKQAAVDRAAKKAVKKSAKKAKPAN